MAPWRAEGGGGRGMRKGTEDVKDTKKGGAKTDTGRGDGRRACMDTTARARGCRE